MKLATISALFAVGSCLSAGIATAATCGPDATLGPISSTATVSGNSCGHNANFFNSTFCGGVSFSTTGNDAWAIQVGASQNFTFTVTSPGTQGGTAFIPDIALLGTCADNGSCINENTTGTGTVTSGTISNQAAGTYFIIVADSSASGAQCGPYDLSFTGTLPVKLENFSVD